MRPEVGETLAGSTHRAGEDDKNGTPPGVQGRTATGATLHGKSNVHRVVNVLRALTLQSGPVTVRDLAAKTNIPKSTVHRIITELEVIDAVETRGTEGYVLSLDSYILAAKLLTKTNTSTLLRAELERLTSATGEAAYLGTRTAGGDTMAFVIGVSAGSQKLQYEVPLGEPAPLYLGASGKAILAWLDQTTIRRMAGQAHAAGALSDGSALEEELETIRRAGYSISRAEKIEGAVGIAAPVFVVKRGELSVFGDVVVTLPNIRTSEEKEAEIATQVVETADRVSAVLGSSNHDRYNYEF
ncbi:IclR family transcriptional regulator [Ornithinimicrobium faecis]|uniref:IclR family transcriptional regulator n=1 Tax=Ornithinimicrobium faecis TaxID=2934158 RepID=UPI00211825D5|nr:IclR family transcriptional regulator [Ornithinimicrobium sp. HY1745]